MIHDKEQNESHPFYGVEVVRRQQQEYIEHLLSQFRHEPASEELKAKIWDLLQQEKYLGRLTIPFKVVMRQDKTKKFPSYIQVILDTKV